MKKYNAMDVLKLFMAICVISLHTLKLNFEAEWMNDLYQNIVRCAVPFFFIASGFLLAKKMKWPYNSEPDLNILGKYIIKIAKFYLIWSIVYLPVTLFYISKINESLTFKIYIYLRGLVFIGEQYDSWMMWYLLSTVYATIMIYILLKLKKSPKKIMVVGCVVLATSLAIDCLIQYQGTLPTLLANLKIKILCSIFDGRILLGGFFLPLGMLLAKKEIPCKIGIIMMLVGFTTNMLINNYVINQVGFILLTVGIFSCIINIKIKDSKVYRILRRMSTIMYFIHMYVWLICCQCIFQKRTFGLKSFIITTVLSAIVAILYILVADSIKNSRNMKNLKDNKENKVEVLQ